MKLTSIIIIFISLPFLTNLQSHVPYRNITKNLQDIMCKVLKPENDHVGNFI